MYADRAPMSGRALVASARTGDLVLYTRAPTPPSSPPPSLRHGRRKEKQIETTVPTIGAVQQETSWFSLSKLLAMLPAAIACSEGVRETTQHLDCVGVVVESAPGTEACVLIYDSDNTLIMLPLSAVVNRPLCLRPLLTSRINNDKQALALRQAVHTRLKHAVDDLCKERVSPSVLAETLNSQCYLVAYLLARAGVIAPTPSEFRAYSPTPDDAEQAFGAEASLLDVNLKAEFAYGNQIWFS